MKQSEFPAQHSILARHEEKKQGKYPMGAGGHTDNFNTAARIGIEFPLKAWREEHQKPSRGRNRGREMCLLTAGPALFEMTLIYRPKGPVVHD